MERENHISLKYSIILVNQSEASVGAGIRTWKEWRGGNPHKIGRWEGVDSNGESQYELKLQALQHQQSCQSQSGRKDNMYSLLHVVVSKWIRLAVCISVLLVQLSARSITFSSFGKQQYHNSLSIPRC